jgi:hypothetical protein
MASGLRSAEIQKTSLRWRPATGPASLPAMEPANDKKRHAKPARRYVFDVYRAAARGRWISQVVARHFSALVRPCNLGARGNSRQDFEETR